MEKKSLTIWTFIVAAMLLGVVNTAAGKKQTQQELKQEQLEEIEKYISQRRQEIEDFYAGRFTELQLRAEADIRRLEVADTDKMVQVGFVARPRFAAKTKFAVWAEFVEAVLQINGFENVPFGRFETILQINGFDVPYGRFKTTAGTSPKRLAVAQSRIAEKRNDILGHLAWEALELERQKRYALTVRLVELEKRLKENVLTGEPEARHGVVTGIVYSEKNPSAIIDGKIIREGDTIHSVRVVKIRKDKIEFEKNGKKWKQKVQETSEALLQ